MPLPKSLHVESAAGELLDATKKAKHQPALDALTARLLPHESIVHLAEASQDNPHGRGPLWGIAALTTERLWMGGSSEAAQLMNFETPISAAEVSLLKRGWIVSDVAVHTASGVLRYGMGKGDADAFVAAAAAVRGNPGAHVRPDVGAFDPNAGPWWEQLAPGYELRWVSCRFAVDPDVIAARDGETIIDRQGVSLKGLTKVMWHAPWSQIIDIATAQLQPGRRQRARSSWNTLSGEVAPGEEALAGIFLVATEEAVATVNIKDLSPTPLTNLLSTLNWFVDAHWKGLLADGGPEPGTSATSEPTPPAPPPAPPAPPPPPPPVAQRPPQPVAGADVEQQLRLLASLHADGVLTDDEFAAKKQMLLDRL